LKCMSIQQAGGKKTGKKKEGRKQPQQNVNKTKSNVENKGRGGENQKKRLVEDTSGQL